MQGDTLIMGPYLGSYKYSVESMNGHTYKKKSCKAHYRCDDILILPVT